MLDTILLIILLYTTFNSFKNKMARMEYHFDGQATTLTQKLIENLLKWLNCTTRILSLKTNGIHQV